MRKAHIYRIGGPEVGHGHIARCQAVGNALLVSGWGVEEYDSLGDICPVGGDIIIVDSNELTRDDVLALRELAPVVNLAARGEAKWYAHASFLHTPYRDGPCPPDVDSPRIWAGTEYQPVRQVFLRARGRRRPPCSPPRKIFVSHGGSDPMGHTELTLEALNKADFLTARINVVLGVDFGRKLDKGLYSMAKQMTVYRGHAPSWMAELMVEADLGICSMGLTTYEAGCVGLPTINICANEFHVEVGKRAQAKGFLRWVSPRVDLVAGAICDLGENEFQLRLTSRNALAYNTGRGAETIAKMIPEVLALEE